MKILSSQISFVIMSVTPRQHWLVVLVLSDTDERLHEYIFSNVTIIILCFISSFFYLSFLSSTFLL